METVDKCTNCGNSLDDIPKWRNDIDGFMVQQDGYKPIHYCSTKCKCHELEFKQRKIATAKVPKDFMKNQLEIDDDFESHNYCSACYLVWYIKHDGCKKPLGLTSTHIIKLDEVIGSINGTPVLLKHIFKDNTDNLATFRGPERDYKCNLSMTDLLLKYIFRKIPVSRLDQRHFRMILYDVLKYWNTTDWETQLIN